MQRMSNGYTYNNDKFPAAFAEYLVMNGYEIDQVWNRLAFTKGSIKLCVMNDNMDVFEWNENALYEADRLVFSHSLQDFSVMNLPKFMWVMDASNLVAVSDFVSNAAKIDQQLGVEAQLIVRIYQDSKYYKHTKSYGQTV